MSKAKVEEELKQATGVVVAEQPAVPATVQDMSGMFEEDAGGGLENLGAGDFSMPFFSILQKNSPQVSKSNAKYIKGAESGNVLNTVSGKTYKMFAADGDRGMLWVPCGYDKKIVRWKPRDSGGGFVSAHFENDPILKNLQRNAKLQLVADNDDIFVDTSYHYGLRVDEDGGFPEFGVVSMFSTQLKKSRNWNTTMRGIMKKSASGRIYNPPSYSHKYRLFTVGESKDSYDWYGWSITSEGEVTDVELYKMAREFSKQVESGAVRVSVPPQEFEAPAAEDVPF